jgi:hypothetical protein
MHVHACVLDFDWLITKPLHFLYRNTIIQKITFCYWTF